MKILSIIISVLILTNCVSSSQIEYIYIDKVETEILETLKMLNNSNFKTKKSNKIFVKIHFCNNTTRLIFNYYENMPKNIQSQIKHTNRYIILKKLRIPIIFMSDDGHNPIRELGVNHGLIGGCLLVIDGNGNVLKQGEVY